MKIINVNLENLNSIYNAECEKMKAENDGLTLFKTVNLGNNKYSLIYK